MIDRLHTAHRIALGLLFLAAATAVSTILAFAAAGSQNLIVILIRMPGRFLAESFHLAAFYVPAVLVAAALLLWSERVVTTHVTLLFLSIVPFFTISLFVRLAADAAVDSSPITALLSSALGRGTAITTAALASLIGLGAMGLLWYRHRVAPNGDRVRPVRVRPARPGDLVSGMRTVRALIAAPSERGSALVVDVDEPPEAPDPEAPPRSLVDLPEPDEGSDPLSVVYEGGRFCDPGPDDPPDADEYDDYDEYDENDDQYPDTFDDERPDVSSAELTPVEAASVLPAEIPAPRGRRYDVPIGGLLHEYADGRYWEIDEPTREAAETLRVTLDEFGIQAEVTGIRKGPVITMFEILPAPGVKLSKIVNLSDNIALRLAASSVRIVAPIPGKHAVGIEIPNRERAIVGFAELLQEEQFGSSRMEIPIALGKDIPGDAQIVDLTRMPHVLIAGATGSGKSVCVNSIICSILYRRAPQEVKLILIDPKIVELKFYNDIPHLLTPVITDPKRAFQALQYCIYEMERRYSLLDSLQVRDVQSYNRKVRAKNLATEPIPYIVVVVDEFADLMATSGKELESTLARLAAMSRAVGIHLVLATQRPSTDVITGLIKANIPSRIAFMVASKVDSRIILDAMGADKLLGRGDMLFTSAWDPFPVRMQGAFLSEEEVERVVAYVKQLGEPEYIDDEIFVDDEDEEYLQGDLEDPLMEQAIEIVTTAGKASASYLQRRLKVGYNRAARMVEEMERIGIVGPQQGSKPRDIIGSSSGYGGGSFG